MTVAFWSESFPTTNSPFDQPPVHPGTLTASWSLHTLVFSHCINILRSSGGPTKLEVHGLTGAVLGFPPFLHVLESNFLLQPIMAGDKGRLQLVYSSAV